MELTNKEKNRLRGVRAYIKGRKEDSLTRSKEASYSKNLIYTHQLINALPLDRRLSA